MKTKNLSYRQFFKRTHYLNEMSLFVFVFIISWPRIILEVFVRKNFGERYFSLFKGIVISALLFPLPLVVDFANNLYQRPSMLSIMANNISWYIGIAAFLFYCFKRYREVEREPGVYDLAKFSYYNGDIDDRFFNVKIKGQKPTRRQVCTLIEPAFFLLIGIVFTLLFQKIGPLIIFCSICYSLGYVGEYVRGDHFIMDTIDQMICNEEFRESFVNDAPPHDTRGFETFGRRPADPNFRRKVVDALFEDEIVDEVF